MRMFSDPILSPPFADGNIRNYIRPMMAMDMGINQINKDTQGAES